MFTDFRAALERCERHEIGMDTVILGLCFVSADAV